MKKLIALSCCIFLAGCAVGFTPEGDAILGVPVGGGDPANVANAAAKAGKGFLAFLMNPAANWPELLLGITGVAGAIFGTKKLGDAKAAQASKDGENKGWEDAQDHFVGKPKTAGTITVATARAVNKDEDNGETPPV